MKGLILTNAFFNSPEADYQPARLLEEFSALGVSANIKRNDFFPFSVEDGSLKRELNYDFCVYLDKDKYVLRALEKCQIPTFNCASAIEVCDDKMLTALALSNEGVPMPKTLPGLLCYNQNATVTDESVEKIISSLSLPLIAKESYGSLGKSVFLVKTKAELLSVMEKLKCKPHLFQEFIKESKGRDLRVIGIGGKAVGAIERKNEDDFRSNLFSGGTATPMPVTEEIKSLTSKIMSALSLDYCGIDLLFSKDGYLVCEVNSNAFFGGFEKATSINVARLYAQHILSKLS